MQLLKSYMYVFLHFFVCVSGTGWDFIILREKVGRAGTSTLIPAHKNITNQPFNSRQTFCKGCLGGNSCSNTSRVTLSEMSDYSLEGGTLPNRFCWNRPMGSE